MRAGRPSAASVLIRGVPVVLGLLVFAISYCAPRYATLHAANGASVDVISVKSEDDVFPGSGNNHPTSRALVFNYFADRSTADTSVEFVLDLIPLAAYYASRTGDTVIVIEQSIPFGSRWFSLQRNRFARFRKSRSGGWRPFSP